MKSLLNLLVVVGLSSTALSLMTAMFSVVFGFLPLELAAALFGFDTSLGTFFHYGAAALAMAWSVFLYVLMTRRAPRTTIRSASLSSPI